MFFPRPGYDHKSAFVTNATINMFFNNKIIKVAKELWGFTHNEMFLMWHIVNETFYKPSVKLVDNNMD